MLSYDGIVGIHDLVLHSYGHSKIIGSLHAEVPSDVDIMESHDTIDLIERDIKEKLGIEISIHMDPILVNDPLTDELRELTAKVLGEISADITFHDFRIVKGQAHTNLIFDIVIPHSSLLKPDEIKNLIESKIRQENEAYFTVINVDRSYV